MARNHMSEAEWTAFAASKNLDPATGGEIKVPAESVGMNDYDFRLLMGQFAKLNNAIERMQIFMVIGFAALAILHFIH
jgi:hypothetical protein